MATEKQIAANRRNAQKCTGPKTREGKFKSSLNALKHGLYAHQHILQTEDESVYQNYVTEVLTQLEPQNTIELELVDAFIQASWRRRRIAAIINQRMNDAIDEVLSSPNDATEPPLPAQLTSQAIATLEAKGSSFLRFEAHELRLANFCQRTIFRLYSLRKQKSRNETNFDPNLLRKVASH
jgi:hypothetical protein